MPMGGANRFLSAEVGKPTKMHPRVEVAQKRYRLEGAGWISATIFDDDKDISRSLSQTLSRSLKCPDYRTLPWLFSYDPRSSSARNENRSGSSARHHKKKSVPSSRSTSHVATTNSINKLKSANFCCINLESRFILDTDHLAWKHADDIKVKLGSPCVYFNHPEFFKKAEKVFAKEYKFKCRQEEKRREEWEKTRKLTQSVGAAYTSGRPIFCAFTEKYPKENQCIPTAEQPKKSVTQKGSRSSGTSRPLFNPRPWRREVLELEGDDDVSRPSETQSTIGEVYANASELIDNRLEILDRQKLIQLLPIVYPQRNGEQ
ncbi:hypothetical protein TcWFU_003383 [Taenia crassiceps]|uniref:Uncharacterized protein n=1 Tax=Taenia crassiceps TaxID=6207 RepID=A0ABR4QKL1_9CEST